jgi:large conductance mechanosensitive channel
VGASDITVTMTNPRIPAAVAGFRKGASETMGGFRAFLIRGNLVDLAVAFVVGAAFAGLVKDLATSLIAPLIALVGGKPSFTHLNFTVDGTTFPYGVFLNSAVAFLITALIVYFFVVLPTTKLIERLNRGQDATERECPHCLSDMPAAARRCRYCTAESEPAALAAEASPAAPAPAD